MVTWSHGLPGKQRQQHMAAYHHHVIKSSQSRWQLPVAQLVLKRTADNQTLPVKTTTLI
jgi:hypothetical protein